MDPRFPDRAARLDADDRSVWGAVTSALQLFDIGNLLTFTPNPGEVECHFNSRHKLTQQVVVVS
jgi:hypothetical protein